LSVIRTRCLKDNQLSRPQFNPLEQLCMPGLSIEKLPMLTICQTMDIKVCL
jgi:hypothetical protein